jgi:sugar lactone lactonase YvrE
MTTGSLPSEQRSAAVQVRRFLFISVIGLAVVAIILATLYLVFQGGARREGTAALTGVKVRPFIQFSAGDVYPTGLARDKAGVVYVSGFGNGALYKVGPDGTPTTWLDRSSGLTAPAAMAFGPDGGLYVLDFSSSDPNRGIGSIKLVTPAGKVTTFGPGQGISGLSFFSQLAFDSRGDLFVTVTAHGEIWRIAPNGLARVWLTLAKAAPAPTQSSASSSTRSATSQPTGLVVDSTRNLLYVSDSDGGIIYRIAINAEGGAGTPERIALVDDQVVPALTLDPQGQLLFTQWAKEDGWVNRLGPDGKIVMLVRNLRAPTGLLADARVIQVANSDLPGLLRQGFISIFSGPKLPFTVDEITLPTSQVN